MELHQSQRRIFLYRLLGKLHQLFQIVLHLFFKIANYRNKEELPCIDNFLLLSSATSLASKIRKQKLKSVDLVEGYISRILDVNPVINAAVAIRRDEAIEEAKAVDKLVESGIKTEEQMAEETPFLGVPFTSKEIICVEGMPLTAGLVSRKGLKADKDAEVVRLMKKAGAIEIAVTNVSELAMWSETHNKVYGRTSNPYDVSRCVGGSSGGEGALLAAAGSVIGLGNDIGGSIRIPACFNGIFGHKPTAGVVPNVGCFAVLNKELDCYLSPGPMCRYATDLLPMLKVLVGRHHAERLQLDVPVKLNSLKIFYMEGAGDYGIFTKVHPDIKAAMLKVLRHFEHAYKIKPQRLELKIMRHAVDVYFSKMRDKGGFQLARAMSNTKEPVNLFIQLLLWLVGQSKHTLHVILVGLFDIISRNLNSSRNNYPVDACRETVEIFQQLMWDNAVFIYPSWPEPAPHHNEMLFKPFNFGYTGIFNILGFPVTSCPVGLCQNGLPIGIQVVSNMNNDRVCIAVAVELEKAFGGWIPPCSVVD